MDSFGYHALCCHGKDMHHRHYLVCWALHKLAFDAELHPQYNAPVQCLGDAWHSVNGKQTNFRPADVLMDWDGARKCCVDVTIVSPIHSHMPTKFFPGKAALLAEEDKKDKHSGPANAGGYNFLPFAADVFGNLAPEARKMLSRIASMVEVTRRLSRHVAKQFVFRRINFAIHLGVARQLVARQELDFFF
jgi:hypothetical protein